MLAKLRDLPRVYRTIANNPGLGGRRARALARAARWQLAKRTGARRALVDVNGARLYCYARSTGASSVLYTGLYDWDEMTFMLRYLRAGDSFVDVGANIGAYSLFAAVFVPGVTVVAVEPADESRARLRENLALNGIDARVCDEVLAAQAGEIAFSTGRDTLNRIVEPGTPRSVTLRASTLDLLVERPPAIVKLDVEGAELEVLKGARATLSATPAPALIVELNGLCERFGATPATLREYLARFGYSLFEYDGGTCRLSEFGGDGYPASKNVIAVTDAAAAERRLAEGVLPLDPYDVRIAVRIERRNASDAVSR